MKVANTLSEKVEWSPVVLEAERVAKCTLLHANPWVLMGSAVTQLRPPSVVVF